MSSNSGNPQSQVGQNQQERVQIVYCHECQDEWRYTGEHSLICPSCQSDFVEIVRTASSSPSNCSQSHPSRFSNLIRHLPSIPFRRLIPRFHLGGFRHNNSPTLRTVVTLFPFFVPLIPYLIFFAISSLPALLILAASLGLANSSAPRRRDTQVENDNHDPSRPQMPLFGDMDEDSDGEEGGPAARFASSFVITGPGGFQIARTFGTLPVPPLPGAPRPSTGGNRASADGGNFEAGGHGASGAPPVQEMNVVSMLQGLLTNILGEAAADRVRQSASGSSPPPVTGDHAPPDPRTPRPDGTHSGENREGANNDGVPPPVEVAELTAFLNTLFGPGAGGAHGLPMPFFQGIIPVPGARGDYVYSNAQLDRVISELMEQHQGNAPPPAPAEVLNNLPKIKVDTKRVMEGEDCTVCKEELNIEEEVAQLPCKHVYHEECIKRWLETRDTCPICRAPTAPEHRQSGDHTNTGGAGQAHASATASADHAASSGQHQQQQQGGGGGLGGWLFGRH